ncbi:helix-turn-helix transcriptional regulator [Actinophytocola sp.]|uniref:helix-turn-helix domain-containing protein n=1 Tax=Actinophytocola sp. TaxID=1872138 RepID=UPI002D73FD67|nr:helix-turn-helix transcriptional regulator [Actinophytocola sp.]HYQ62434.1 helix-turn-helix transcriptional regulator [Actinophytocola sp.]
MVRAPDLFGPRLRALRVARQLSLTEFARRLYYSKGYVSRIETGKARPSVEFARRCDMELDTDGALATLVAASAAQEPEPEPEDDEALLMTMAPDCVRPVGPRNTVAGAAEVLAGRPPGTSSAETGAEQLTYLTQLLATMRGLGQVARPETVLPVLAGQAQALRLLANRARGVDARRVVALFARTAEFAGWMAQEAGDDRTAMWWTGLAAGAADAVDDQHTATYALVRRASITLYRGDARATVALARQAQAGSGIAPRVRGLAAQREAQGHALAGDRSSCLRALDVARRHLLAADTVDDRAMVIGTSFVLDPVTAVTGWCLLDLGRPAEAVAVLDEQVARIAPGAFRARARFGVRLALAHAATGEVERACGVAGTMLEHATAIRSATVRADVARLSTTLRRFSRHPAVRAVAPALAVVLHPEAG